MPDAAPIATACNVWPLDLTQGRPAHHCAIANKLLACEYSHLLRAAVPFIAMQRHVRSMLYHDNVAQCRAALSASRTRSNATISMNEAYMRCTYAVP